MNISNPKSFIQYKTIRAIFIMIQLINSSSFQFISRNSIFGKVVRRHAKVFPHRNGRELSICTMTIADTPLATDKGAALLDGLDVYAVPATGDNHPISVYSIDSSEPKPDENILLLLHGRTWSSVPVYHLLGGPKNAEKGLESRSTMEAFRDKNIRPYTMDFRGFGGTPRADKYGVEPNRCVEDVESVLRWITERHGTTSETISLLGWSQGAMVAQLAAQKRRPDFAKLILYGSIVDPMVRYPREPLYTLNKEEPTDITNTYDAAVEDFTIEGTIPSEPARIFAEAALTSDPVKGRWKSVFQFNNCDASRVHVPTLVVSIVSLLKAFFCS
jgi:pimeloyl-ACP methyl ester carboxylesterase